MRLSSGVGGIDGRKYELQGSADKKPPGITLQGHGGLPEKGGEIVELEQMMQKAPNYTYSSSIEKHPELPQKLPQDQVEQNDPNNTYYLVNEKHPKKHSRISRLRSMYDLEEGRISCRCLLRRWKFCPHIKGMADGHPLNAKLLATRTIAEVNPTNPNPTNPPTNATSSIGGGRGVHDD